MFLSAVLTCSAAQQEEEQTYRVFIEGKTFENQDPLGEERPFFEITAKKSVMDQLAMIQASDSLSDEMDISQDDQPNGIYLQKGHTKRGFMNSIEYLKQNDDTQKITFLSQCHVRKISDLMYCLNALGYDQQEFLRMIKTVLEDPNRGPFNALLKNRFLRHNAACVATILKKKQLAALTDPIVDRQDLAHPCNLGDIRALTLKMNGLWFELSIKDVIENNDTKHLAMPQMINGELILDLENYFLTSLEGLDLVPNIDQVVRFRFENNKIAALETGIFTCCSSAKIINCGDNKITVIKPGVFVNLPSLEAVHLADNQITEIEVGGISNLPCLVYFDCSGNCLSAESLSVFKSFPSLRFLNLRQNRIAEVLPASFSGLPELKELDLRSNQITGIRSGAFAYLPNLNKIYLNNNRITSLTATSFMAAAQLVHHVRKRELLPSLKVNALVSFPCLEGLELDNNPLDSFDVGIFALIPQLHKLDLSHHLLDGKQQALINHSAPKRCVIRYL